MPSTAVSHFPSSGSSTAQHPPSTASVVEYICLFTHDLKRKQKRWQDGRLKFHTFNKRVMVYDNRGNFIGDMHWREDYDIDEEEEIQLERGGTLVQVSECVGRREQDLSELVDKRIKEREQRQLKATARSSGMSVPPMPPRTALRRPPPDHFQTRDRPLHQLIGTPSGQHGKALVPTESPFAQRRRTVAAASPSTDEHSRPAKRSRRDNTPPLKSGYAQNLFGTRLCLSSQSLGYPPLPPQRRGHQDRDSSLDWQVRDFETAQRQSLQSFQEQVETTPRHNSPVNLEGGVAKDKRIDDNQIRDIQSAPLSDHIGGGDATQRQPLRPLQQQTRAGGRNVGPAVLGENCAKLKRGEIHSPRDVAPGSAPHLREDPLQPIPLTTSRRIRQDPPESGDQFPGHTRPHTTATHTKRYTKEGRTQRYMGEEAQLRVVTQPQLSSEVIDLDELPGLSAWPKSAAQPPKDGESSRSATASPSVPTKQTSICSKVTPADESLHSTKQTPAVVCHQERGPDVASRIPEGNIEPRTELRIKPRQKRGLLMLSDKAVEPKVRARVGDRGRRGGATIPQPKGKPTRTSPRGRTERGRSEDRADFPSNIVVALMDGPTDHCGDLGTRNVDSSSRLATSIKPAQDIIETTTTRAKRPIRHAGEQPAYHEPRHDGLSLSMTGDLGGPPMRDIAAETVQETGKGTERRSKKRSRQVLPPGTDEDDEPLHFENNHFYNLLPSEIEGCGPPPEASADGSAMVAPKRKRTQKNTRKRANRCPEDSNGSSDEPPSPEQPPKGPRLVKLGRKSVKSKELIGLDFGDEPFRNPFAPAVPVLFRPAALNANNSNMSRREEQSVATTQQAHEQHTLDAIESSAQGLENSPSGPAGCGRSVRTAQQETSTSTVADHESDLPRQSPWEAVQPGGTAKTAIGLHSAVEQKGIARAPQQPDRTEIEDGKVQLLSLGTEPRGPVPQEENRVKQTRRDGEVVELHPEPAFRRSDTLQMTARKQQAVKAVKALSAVSSGECLSNPPPQNPAQPNEEVLRGGVEHSITSTTSNASNRGIINAKGSIGSVAGLRLAQDVTPARLGKAPSDPDVSVVSTTSSGLQRPEMPIARSTFGRHHSTLVTPTTISTVQAESEAACTTSQSRQSCQSSRCTSVIPCDRLATRSPNLDDQVSIAPNSARGSGVLSHTDVAHASPSLEVAAGPSIQASTMASARPAKSIPSTTTATTPGSGGTAATTAITNRPRISNPATRGRKAAVRSDAAGQVPQHILPPDLGPGLLALQRTGAAAAAAAAAGTMAMLQQQPLQQVQGGDVPAPGVSRPKITMKFPGFASASVSGPWSREAHDLLGIGRPTG